MRGPEKNAAPGPLPEGPARAEAEGEAIFVLSHGRIVEANAAAEELLGTPRAAMLGLALCGFAAGDETGLAEALAHPQARHFEQRFERHGHTRLGHVTIQPLTTVGAAASAVVVRDLTRERRERRRLEHVARLHATLSRTNEALARARDPAEVMARVCEIAVSEAGFVVAWLGVPGPEGRTLAVARAEPSGTSDGAPLRLDGLLPCQAAWRERRTVVCNHLSTSTRPEDLAAAGLAGVQAAAALPVGDGEATVGVLFVGSATAGWFDADGMALLERMADDVSLALARFADARRRAASEAESRALRRERERATTLLQHVSERLGSHAGEAFFGELASVLRAALGADGVAVARVEERGQNVEWVLEGKSAPAREAPLEQSLTARTLAGGGLQRASGEEVATATDPWAAALGRGTAWSQPLLDPAGRALGVLHVLFRESPPARLDPAGLLHVVALRAASELERVRAGQARQAALLHTIEALSLAIEKRDPYTAGHQRRVAELSEAIGRELGLPAARVEGLRVGALIHDLGKIAVPGELLTKPGRLLGPEFELMKLHCAVGADIVQNIAFPWPVMAMVRQHHERLDGSGYPDGLRGDEIVEEARIVAVADVVEAISAHRPYRAALGLEAAFAELRRGRGTSFHAPAVDACLQLFADQRFSFQPRSGLPDTRPVAAVMPPVPGDS